jgi:hypothetical protein
MIQNVAHSHGTGITPTLVGIRVIDVLFNVAADCFRKPVAGRIGRIMDLPRSSPGSRKRRSSHFGILYAGEAKSLRYGQLPMVMSAFFPSTSSTIESGLPFRTWQSVSRWALFFIGNRRDDA